MANIELNFPRDTTEVSKPEATGYTIHITRNDDEPMSAPEVHALLAQIAADRPLASLAEARPAQHTYTFTGRDFVYELIQWSDQSVNIKTMKMGRAANPTWRHALMQMRLDQEQQVVSLQSKTGAMRLLEAGYLTPHAKKGHYIVAPQYAGYKMGWRPTDSVIIFGVAFPMSMLEAQNNQPDQ